MQITRCRICRHAKRSEIERGCDSFSLAEIAFVFSVSETSLERHLEQHADVRVELEAPPTERSPQASFSEPIPSSRLRRIVLDTLERYPDARAEVIEAIEREERAA